MSKLLALQICNDASDLAHLLGFQPKALGYIAWGTKARYSTFDIPKRSGGRRTINAPIPQLKLAQQKLSDLLQECEREIEETLNVRHRLSHGFRKKHSILTNAAVHRGQRYVLNFDLQDFFDSINFGRVRGYFMMNKHFRLRPDVATLIAQIACHDSKLPQGAPTSPVISNLVGNILDMRLVKLARANGCAYSRYADDITISTSLPVFPGAIAIEGPTRSWVLSKAVSDAVKASGFHVNEAKTRLQYCLSRQDVTGIVVNKCVNVNSDYQRRLRVMVHHLRSTGKFYLKSSTLSGAGGADIQQHEGTTAQLQGMINFVLQVERFRRGEDPPPIKLSRTEKLYQRFLFYTQFANHDKPVLLFEGKTDVMYLSAAMKSLAATYPALIAKTQEMLIHLLRYTPRIERLFGLSGGGSQLITFIKNYHEEYRYIQGPRGARPVIVILDNDKVGRDTINLVEKMTKTSVPAGAQSVRVYDNLYVVLTSPYERTAKHHCIEDCFDPAFIASELAGKKISKGTKGIKLDPATEVSKAWFADKIIKPNSKSIDFSGFQPILNEIVTVIVKHVP